MNGQKPILTLRGKNLGAESFRDFMTEWSLRQAEANHVETIEEANDFNIDEDDEDIIHPSLTVYEMQEAAEDNLAVYEREQKEAEAYEKLLASESNENANEAREIPENTHAQSALVQTDSTLDSSLSSQQTQLDVDLTANRPHHS